MCAVELSCAFSHSGKNGSPGSRRRGWESTVIHGPSGQEVSKDLPRARARPSSRRGQPTSVATVLSRRVPEAHLGHSSLARDLMTMASSPAATSSDHAGDRNQVVGRHRVLAFRNYRRLRALVGRNRRIQRRCHDLRAWDHRGKQPDRQLGKSGWRWRVAAKGPGNPLRSLSSTRPRFVPSKRAIIMA